MAESNSNPILALWKNFRFFFKLLHHLTWITLIICLFIIAILQMWSGISLFTFPWSVMLSAFLSVIIGNFYIFLFIFFAHFSIDLLISYWVYNGSLYILAISPLSDMWFINAFYQTVGRLFTLLMVSFEVQKYCTKIQRYFNFGKVHFIYFSVCCLGLVYYG